MRTDNPSHSWFQHVFMPMVAVINGLLWMDVFFMETPPWRRLLPQKASVEAPGFCRQSMQIVAVAESSSEKKENEKLAQQAAQEAGVLGILHSMVRDDDAVAHAMNHNSVFDKESTDVLVGLAEMNKPEVDSDALWGLVDSGRGQSGAVDESIPIDLMEVL